MSEEILKPEETEDPGLNGPELSETVKSIEPPLSESEAKPDPDNSSSEEEKEKKSPIFETRLETGEERKREGNEYFKSGNYKEAIKKYETGLYHVEFDEMSWNFELMEEHRESVNKVRLPLLLNSAVCWGKLAETDSLDHAIGKVIELCNEALKIDPVNSKAFFKRGQAHLSSKKYEQAVSDLREALKGSPKDKLVRSTLQVALVKAKEEELSSKKFWQEKLGKAMKGEEIEKPAASFTESQSLCQKLLNCLRSLFNPLLEKGTKSD
mmetsp:Transcript_9474/g.10792  ORF Transcript_9474/g.10792 Transcript_9474/m.10792 type:complete len:267 (-) Transcript_9474:710-1510(-)|eukprot:CAMPEP_0184021274 /NCGR_PEP_ID=MMETSP0954-20121128/9831_1 /TAXON_ID=627963 /ORGANISM="Aplanochytrium sp, Strain PBS07" /LENGTH=266 /DNA_ID=CAMNT_0026303263 /DNA_START=72 /DNA_END=872 /DNA_ORIENTATION=-